MPPPQRGIYAIRIQTLATYIGVFVCGGGLIRALKGCLNSSAELLNSVVIQGRGMLCLFEISKKRAI